MNDEHVPGGLPAVVHSGVEKAIGIQHSTVTKYVQRLRRRRPGATPAEIISTLERQYLAAIIGVGAAVGGAAALPGIGAGLAATLGAGEMALFLETTALFTLAIAEVHAIRVAEAERRRTLVLTVALGDDSTVLVEKMAGRTGEHWGKLVTDLIPMSSISAVNKTLSHWFMTQYSGGLGMGLIGKAAPFGIGVGIGAVGNFGFGRMAVNASRRVFGPPPVSFTESGIVTLVGTPPAAVAPAPEPESAATPELAVPSSPAAATATTGATASTTTTAATSTERPEQLASPERSGSLSSPITGKYRPLFDRLAYGKADRVELDFSEIGAVVTGGLPKSAFTARSWWSNSPGSRQARAWLAAGFTVTEVSLAARRVRFEKRARTS